MATLPAPRAALEFPPYRRGGGGRHYRCGYHLAALPRRAMIGLALVLMACALLACGPVPGKPLPVGQVERIRSRAGWLNVVYAPRPYRHVSAPLFGSYYILIAESGRYCQVDERDFFSGPNDGELYQCRWRTPR